MAVDSTTLLFFDAAALVAAAGRPTGGSGFLLSLVERRLLAGGISPGVLLEAERNIRTKLPPEAWHRFHAMLLRTPLTVTPLPPPTVVGRYVDIVGEKDAHVVAAALRLGALFLITLDQPLARRLAATALPIRPLSPGEFIRTKLPTHPDYATLRNS